MGMKAQLKKQLIAHGIRRVRNDEGSLVKLQLAKTADLIHAVAALD